MALPQMLMLAVSLVAMGCGGETQDVSSGGGSSSATGGAGGLGSGGDHPGGAGGGHAGGGGAAGGQGGMGPDPCTLVEPQCPGAPPNQMGQGLVPLDRCAFAMTRTDSFDKFATRIAALKAIAPPIALASVLDDLNRTAVPIAAAAVPGTPAAVDFAFRWETSENTKATWVPQGITGSADADPSGLVLGRRLVLVSFYWNATAAPAEAQKGVRVALVDVTDPSDPKYRFLLLVEPKDQMDWGIVDVHAGGLAWFGDHLYVAATGFGVRVFDMREILLADTSEDVIGCESTTCKAGLYKYVLPQVGSFQRTSGCDPQPIFSFVGLDRSSTPPSLITGEYCSDTACTSPLAGRVFRYPLDPNTGLLTGDVTYAKDAYTMGERQVQGAAAIGGTFFLSSSEPPAGAGALYRVTVADRALFGWVDSPEDLMVDGPHGLLFGLSEATGERAVFAAALSAYGP